MADDESPDHTGLCAQARDLWFNDPNVQAITQFGITCWTAGRDSQETELATLRKDRSRLNDEVNALATRVAALEASNAKWVKRELHRKRDDVFESFDDRASWATGEALAEEEG